ncbi:MAG: hypothetical protein ACD_24C00334G0006 [uncultured bacterium]|nr:MAG: hypothetical protein ACD_24C00334G0006 [uncultured bacterium]
MNNNLKSLSKRYAELAKKYSGVIAQFGNLVIDGKSIITAKKAITLEEAENIAKIRKELREVDDQIAALLRKKHE